MMDAELTRRLHAPIPGWMIQTPCLCPVCAPVEEFAAAHAPTLYPVFCAWCAPHGTVTVIGEAQVEGSHGICKSCFNTVRRNA
jgi:hypothetical protein